MSTFGTAVASAFVPVVNIELVLIAVSAALPRGYAIPLILAALGFLGRLTRFSVVVMLPHLIKAVVN